MLIDPSPLDDLHPIIKKYTNINTEALLYFNFCIETEYKNESLSANKFYKDSLDFNSKFIESQIRTMYFFC